MKKRTKITDSVAKDIFDPPSFSLVQEEKKSPPPLPENRIEQWVKKETGNPQISYPLVKVSVSFVFMILSLLLGYVLYVQNYQIEQRKTEGRKAVLTQTAAIGSHTQP